MKKSWEVDELIAFEDKIGDLYLENSISVYTFHLLSSIYNI